MSNNKTNVERETKKLTIHSTLWVKPIEIVGINDVVLNTLNVKGKYVPKYDLTDGGGFWLYIDDLEGYFEFDNGIGFFQVIFKDAEQERLYDRIWDQIIDNIDNNKTIKDIKKIRLNSDDLPLGLKFEIKNITIIIEPVVKKDGVYYPQISLNNCTYKV